MFVLFQFWHLTVAVCAIAFCFKKIYIHKNVLKELDIVIFIIISVISIHKYTDQSDELLPGLEWGFCHALLRPFRWYHCSGNLTWHVFFPSEWQVIRDSSGWRCFLHSKKSTPRKKPSVVSFGILGIFGSDKKPFRYKMLFIFIFFGGEHGVDQKQMGDEKKTTTREISEPTVEAFCWPSDGGVPLVPGWAWVIYKVPVFRGQASGPGCWLVAILKVC